LKNLYIKFGGLYSKRVFVITILVVIKLSFQLIVISSGMRWLTADDYSRAVISWEWLNDPKIYSGVWLSLHFWINGIFIWIFRDLTLAPVICSTLFSVLSLIYFYLITERLFNRKIAFISSLIYCVFPFQVWLSYSSMPEPVFFFFICLSVYYFIKWYEQDARGVLYLLIASVSLAISNLLRYEGWFFTSAFLVLVSIIILQQHRSIKQTVLKISVSAISLFTIFWWLYQNYADYQDPFYFLKETNRIYSELSGAGILQKIIQYPFFVFYIAPLTTLLALGKIYITVFKKTDHYPGSFSLIRLFLLLNLTELLILMISGIIGTGGTNMISRYVVLNAVFLIPFAVWQLSDLRKYIYISGAAVVVIVNIVWCYYYQQAFREDTYEVAELTRKLIKENYITDRDKIYFEPLQGYYDIFPIKVISNKPDIFVSDTIPTYFSAELPASKKLQRKKREEEKLKLNILELRKYIEKRNIKLFIVRSSLMIDKLSKLSYKSEQIGDYRIFYIAENKIKHRNINGEPGKSYPLKRDSEKIYFEDRLILKEFRIDNSNFGVNPQTISLVWDINDISVLDSLDTENDEYGRYKARVEIVPVLSDSSVYDSEINIFSERNIERYFEEEQLKNIIVIKPFAMLYYSVKFKTSPFESGLYELRLSVIDSRSGNSLKVYKGDSLYIHFPDYPGSDLLKDSVKISNKKSKHRERYLKDPYYYLGSVIAMFPNTNYTKIMRKSSELSRVILRNGFMLPFLNRYQGDHMLDIVFTYF